MKVSKLAMGIMFLMVIPRAPTAPNQSYIDSYNQAEQFRYWSQLMQNQQQQQTFGNGGVDSPPPIPVTPPIFLFEQGGPGGD
jgi:hypothetical protein